MTDGPGPMKAPRPRRWVVVLDWIGFLILSGVPVFCAVYLAADGFGFVEIDKNRILALVLAIVCLTPIAAIAYFVLDQDRRRRKQP